MKTLGNLVLFDTLGEMVDPAHTALVIWDCQNLLVNSIFNREDFLKNLKALLAAARKKNIPVTHAGSRLSKSVSACASCGYIASTKISYL